MANKSCWERLATGFRYGGWLLKIRNWMYSATDDLTSFVMRRDDKLDRASRVILSIAAVVFVGILVKFLWALFFAEAKDLRGIGLVVIALLGAPFAIWRLIIHDRQVHVDEQRRLTEMITEAVKMLGECKTVKEIGGSDENEDVNFRDKTVENMEVRTGAIRILERVAEDSERDSAAIRDVLAAYLHCRVMTCRFFHPDQDLEAFLREMRPMDTDVQRALGFVFRRFSGKAKGIKLRETPLAKAVFNGCDVTGTEFRDSRLEGVLSLRSDFQQSQFVGSRLEGAVFRQGQMSEVEFDQCKMYAAQFDNCQCKSVELRSSILQKLHFSGGDSHEVSFNSCQLSGSEISDCKFEQLDVCYSDCTGIKLMCPLPSRIDLSGSFFWRAELASGLLGDARLEGAYFFDMDLSATGVASEQLVNTIGDQSVRLPDGVSPPDSWLDGATGELFSYSQEKKEALRENLRDVYSLPAY